MWQENETILIASRPSSNGAGSFGIPGTVKPNGRIECQKWETCRDRFQSSGAKLSVFWFRTGTQDGQNIAEFFDKIETTLKVKKKTQFGPTSCGDAIWVRWSPFWKKYSMRRSLFTALLRISLQYDRVSDNYEEILGQTTYLNKNKYSYIAYTRNAFDYFMEGNTVYTGLKSSGWQNAFYMKANGLQDLLRKPVKPATA